MKEIIIEQIEDYLKANKLEKKIIIDSVVKITNMHRKSVIRAFSRIAKERKVKNPSKLGRPKLYTAETEAALAFVWEIYNYPSAERIIDELPNAIRILKRDKMWNYSKQATDQLLSMSLGSMKLRTVAMAKKRHLMRGTSTTQSGPLLKSIPTFFGDWSLKGVGYGQVDTVVHCGSELYGSMAYTVNYVDVATYWQEPVAQLDKNAEVTLTSLQTIARRLPWRLKGIHPDSGSEFINQYCANWCKKRNIELTRSRSNKKNDNCYIEQRNLTTIRRYIGYDRYDSQQAVDLINQIYSVLRLYINFFQPSFKLQGKEKVIDQQGKQIVKRTKKIYDKPKTPYKRVLERPDVSQKVKDELTRQYETLNPKTLRDIIEELTIKLERTQKR